MARNLRQERSACATIFVFINTALLRNEHLTNMRYTVTIEKVHTFVWSLPLTNFNIK